MTSWQLTGKSFLRPTLRALPLGVRHPSTSILIFPLSLSLLSLSLSFSLFLTLHNCLSLSLYFYFPPTPLLHHFVVFSLSLSLPFLSLHTFHPIFFPPFVFTPSLPPAFLLSLTLSLTSHFIPCHHESILPRKCIKLLCPYETLVYYHHSLLRFCTLHSRH